MKIKIIYLDNLAHDAMLYPETWLEKLLVCFTGTVVSIKEAPDETSRS